MYTQALDKIEFESHTNKNILDDGLIRLIPHKANKTLSIIDTGIGMTRAGRKVSLFHIHLHFMACLLIVIFCCAYFRFGI